MLDFIETTTKVMKEKLPNTVFSSVDYRCSDGVMILHVSFYDSKFKKKAFDFMYYSVPRTLTDTGALAYEFTAYLNTKVIPCLE